MKPPIQVALAILYRQEKFLLQLRDDIPSIVHPGVWALFGGKIEEGETPEMGFRREVKEEIAYDVPSANLFKCYEEPHVIRHVFHSPLIVDLDQLILGEGSDMALATLEEIQAGHCYSPRGEAVKALANPHRQILLEFCAQNPGLWTSS